MCCRRFCCFTYLLVTYIVCICTVILFNVAVPLLLLAISCFVNNENKTASEYVLSGVKKHCGESNCSSYSFG